MAQSAGSLSGSEPSLNVPLPYAKPVNAPTLVGTKDTQPSVGLNPSLFTVNYPPAPSHQLSPTMPVTPQGQLNVNLQEIPHQQVGQQPTASPLLSDSQDQLPPAASEARSAPRFTVIPQWSSIPPAASIPSLSDSNSFPRIREPQPAIGTNPSGSSYTCRTRSRSDPPSSQWGAELPPVVRPSDPATIALHDLPGTVIPQQPSIPPAASIPSLSESNFFPHIREPQPAIGTSPSGISNWGAYAHRPRCHSYPPSSQRGAELPPVIRPSDTATVALRDLPGTDPTDIHLIPYLTDSESSWDNHFRAPRQVHPGPDGSVAPLPVSVPWPGARDTSRRAQASLWKATDKQYYRGPNGGENPVQILQNLMDRIASEPIWFPPASESGLANIMPSNGASVQPLANFQRILTYIQHALKDWLPELPPQTKILRVAQMDLPAMQREGWPIDRIEVIERFRPVLLHFRNMVIQRQELQQQAFSQLLHSESDMVITTPSASSTSQGETGGDKVEPSSQSGSLTADLSTSERELAGAKSKAGTTIMRGTKRHLEAKHEQNAEEQGATLKASGYITLQYSILTLIVHQRGKIIHHDYADTPLNRMDSPLRKEDTTEGTTRDMEMDPLASDGEATVDTQSGQISCEEIFQRLVKHGCMDLSLQMDPRQYSSGLIVGGAFGDIWKGKLRDGTEVAIKVWRFSSLLHNGWKTVKRAMREIYYWSKVKHEYVQELMGVIMFQGRLGMVSRWMEHGNLREYICKNPSVDRYMLCVQVATGIAYLHDREMVHGDIKGTNILVSCNGVTKLSDFDHSIMSDCSLAFSETSKMGGGTTRWMAPELIVDDNGNRNSYTDVYALGMTMLEIITGTSPYYPQYKTDVSVMLAIVKKTLPVRPMDHLSDNLRDNRMWELLLSCWSYDPLARPKAAEVVESLRTIVTLSSAGSPV